MTKHTYPLPIDKIFKYQWKQPPNSISAINIDLEEFLPVFFDDVRKISEKYRWDVRNDED